MKYDSIIFESLIVDNIIPINGLFEITDTLLEEYIKLYGLYNGSSDFGTNSNKQYAKKLAGLSFLKLNRIRASSSNEFNSLSSGIVYIISNPAFENYVKIGITKNLKKRLQAYQTYDPFRRFRIEHYFIFNNAKELEKYILKHPIIEAAKGEWVKSDNVKELFLSGR